MRLRSYRTLLLTLLVALGTCYYYFDVLLPQARARDVVNDMGASYAFGGDFYPIWMTGRELLLHGTNPYTPEMTRKIQIGLYGRTMDPRRPADPPADYRAYSYPLYADLLVAPLLPLGFNAVRVVLGLVLPVLTAASLVLWLRAFRLRASTRTIAIAIILLLVSYPVLEGLYAQQAGLVVGALLALSAALMARERFFLAGVLLACASVKPQLVWLLAPGLLLWACSDFRRRKGLALGFVLTLGILFLTSELVLPGWLHGWWHSLVGYSRYTLPPLTQLLLGKYIGDVAGVCMLALAGAIFWAARRLPADSAEFSLAISFVLVATVLLAPTGGAVYDQIVLIPAFAWLAFHRAEILNARRVVRVLAILAVCALCWQWVAACGVALVALFFPVWATNPSVVVFPERTAAPLPFVLMVLLAFFVVRVLRTSRALAGALASQV